MTRKSLSKRERFAILHRDGFACRYCGAAAPDVRLHVDHVKAVANGGDNDPDNLVTACQDCNLGKRCEELDYLPDQAGYAMVAFLFQVARDKFPSEIPADGFEQLIDWCLSVEDQSGHREVMLGAVSWEGAMDRFRRLHGFPMEWGDDT